MFQGCYRFGQPAYPEAEGFVSAEGKIGHILMCCRGVTVERYRCNLLEILSWLERWTKVRWIMEGVAFPRVNASSFSTTDGTNTGVG